MEAQRIALYILIALIVIMVVAIISIIVTRNLSLWRQEPGRFWKDVKEASFVVWIFGAIFGFFPTFFLFFVPATQAEFNIGVWVALAWAIWAFIPLATLA